MSVAGGRGLTALFGRSPDRGCTALGRALEKLLADSGGALVLAEEIFSKIMVADAVEEETDTRYIGELGLIDGYFEKLGIERDLD